MIWPHCVIVSLRYSIQLNIIVISQRNRIAAVLSETTHSLSKAVVAHVAYKNNLSNGYSRVFSFGLVEPVVV